MSGRFPIRSAALGAVLGCLLLGGCTFWRAHTPFHHRGGGGCTEKPFAGNTATRPPLVVPSGLSAPDTRGSVKIPALTTPERARAASEPCLEEPPAYGDYTVRPALRPASPPPPATPPPALPVGPAPANPAPAN